MYFRSIVFISTCKRAGPSLEQTWIPFTQRWIVPSLVKIGPVVLVKMKMGKVYRQTDDRWQEIINLKNKILSLESIMKEIQVDAQELTKYNSADL